MSEYEELHQLLLTDHEKYLPYKFFSNDCHCANWIRCGYEIEAGSGNLDFLFLDRYAIPTLVECKLSKNKQSKSAIIGQLLEYLAYARYNWSSDYLFLTTLENHDFSLIEVKAILDMMNVTISVDTFFHLAEFNIRNSIARLVFYIDNAPEELLHTVDLLQQISKACNLNYFIIDLSSENMPTVRKKSKFYVPEKFVIDKEKYFFERLQKNDVEEVFSQLHNVLIRYNFTYGLLNVDWYFYNFSNSRQLYIGWCDDDFTLEIYNQNLIPIFNDYFSTYFKEKNQVKLDDSIDVKKFEMAIKECIGKLGEK